MTATSGPLRERLIQVARDGSFRYADIVDRILAELAGADAHPELELLRKLEAWARKGRFEGPTVTPLLAELDALRAKAGT